MKHPEIPVVILSGAHDAKTVRSAILEGAMGFIPKTHSADLLVGALRLILVHKGVYLPPDLAFDVPESGKVPRGVDGVITPNAVGLTPRQADVLYQILQGKSNKAIGRALGIEEPTVKAHVNAVLRVLNVSTRTEAVIVAHRMRLVFSR
jgi:DNA-binding NarL/FixJ family response regulator